MLKRTLNTSAALTKRLKADEQGNIAMMLGVSLMVILGALGLAIDVSSMHKAKEELQMVADTAALAIAREQISNQSKMDATANAYLSTQPNLGAVTLNSASRVGDSYSVDASVFYDTAFMHLFGKAKMEIRAASTTVYDVREFNIALVLDTTGSMGLDASGTTGSKMDSLKLAANDLITSLDNVPGNSVRMSVVPFEQYVNVGTANRNASYMDVSASAWNGCVGARTGTAITQVAHNGADFPGVAGVDPWGREAGCGAAILPLTSNLPSVRARVNSMTPSGWTYIAGGLQWGWRTLSPTVPFTEVTASTNPNSEKIIILMTDGTNTRGRSGERHDTEGSTSADLDTSTLCTVVKADDITIYTIAYEITDTSTQTLMRNCATSTSTYFKADDSADLRDAFTQISASIQTLRLTN